MAAAVPIERRVKLETLLESERRRANTGQVLRMASIPMDADAGLSGFERLHGRDGPGVFAQRIAQTGEAAHGAVGMEWLRRLSRDLETVPGIVAQGIGDFVKEVAPSIGSGQVGRVARRFGLVAAAGELATHYGLTGWGEGEAADAAAACFRAWLEDFGAGLHEDRATCEQVRLFLEQHGASRFQRMEANAPHIVNRAGFWRDGRNSREYLVLPETFKSEVLKGHDLKQASKALRAAGILLPGNDKTAITVRLPEVGPTRVYCLTIPQEVMA